jgi:ribosomal protein S18 acetylase RimI-like enzyme
LGYRTDLIFPAFDGEVIDRGAYLVIRTPANPTYYWGNFLLFSQSPGEGDFRRWRELFALEIGAPPETEHQVFGWDSPEGEEGLVEPFLQAGFRLNREVVMTSSEPHSPAQPSQLAQIRALQTEADWEQAVENQVLCREAEFEEGEYRTFREQRMAQYWKMAAAGLGNWFGAFVGERLVADLGLFHDGGVGRYQSVETHPDFRRQGIAGTLVFQAGRQTKAKYNLHTLVIVAEQGSGAARLYESVGFQPTEKQVGLEWWPEMERHADDTGQNQRA